MDMQKSWKRFTLIGQKKRDEIFYITGHVKLGIAPRFTGDIKIINQTENWQGTGKVFEYYRRNLDPEEMYVSKPDPAKGK